MHYILTIACHVVRKHSGFFSLNKMDLRQSFSGEREGETDTVECASTASKSYFSHV